MEIDEGGKIYYEPGQRGRSANFLPALLDKRLGGFAGGGKKKHENNNTSSHDKYASPSLSLKMLAGIELDLDAYVNDTASHQPSIKPLCTDQMLLVTTAKLSSSSASPKRISIYNNKRTALSSPAKGGISSQNPPCGGGHPQGIPPVRAQITPKANLKEAFNNALEAHETQWDAERTVRKAKMALYNKLVDKVEKDDVVKEAACMTQIEILQEKFTDASQNKDSCNKSNNNIAVIELGNDNSICDAESDEEDKEFSFHSLDGLAKEKGDDHGKLGQDTDGSSPIAAGFKRNAIKEDELPNWLNEINLIRLYDKPELLSALINQFFPCIACNNYKNINNHQTWVGPHLPAEVRHHLMGTI
jgi:hypothetical protein